jgi:hypothetical protein
MLLHGHECIVAWHQYAFRCKLICEDDHMCCYRAQQWWIIQNRKDREIENWDVDLRCSAMCLRPQECSYISLYDLGLQHNILIRKLYLYVRILKNPKTLADNWHLYKDLVLFSMPKIIRATCSNNMLPSTSCNLLPKRRKLHFRILNSLLPIAFVYLPMDIFDTRKYLTKNVI